MSVVGAIEAQVKVRTPDFRLSIRFMLWLLYCPLLDLIVDKRDKVQRFVLGRIAKRLAKQSIQIKIGNTTEEVALCDAEEMVRHLSTHYEFRGGAREG